MANHNLAQPADSFILRLFDRVGSGLTWIGEVLTNTREIAAAVRECEHLLSLSDEQLAARGMRRGTVVSQVFARYHIV